MRGYPNTQFSPENRHVVVLQACEKEGLDQDVPQAVFLLVRLRDNLDKRPKKGSLATHPKKGHHWAATTRE